jgi:hypothetical protein
MPVNNFADTQGLGRVYFMTKGKMGCLDNLLVLDMRTMMQIISVPFVLHFVFAGIHVESKSQTCLAG